jgi:hypothetical protein
LSDRRDADNESEIARQKPKRTVNIRSSFFVSFEKRNCGVVNPQLFSDVAQADLRTLAAIESNR